MKRLTLFSVSIIVLINLIYSQDIINETGRDGKFIVRDAEEQEAMIIEDGNVGITGELSVTKMPLGVEGNSFVVWDKEDSKFKLFDPIGSTESALSTPLLSINDVNAVQAIHDLGVNGYAKTVQAGISEVYFENLGLRIKNIYTPATGWARGLLKYTGNTDNIYFQFGGAGNGQTFSYAFIGPAYNNTWQVWRDGKVGIGTRAPAALLHIKSSDTFGHLRIDSQNGSRGQVSTYDSGTLLINSYTSSVTPGDIKLCGGDVVNTRSLVLKGSGNLGIGTATPDEKLHIAGNMRLNGAFEDKDGQKGASGQILSSTGTQTNWINAPTGGADNLGNHSATQDIQLNGYEIALEGGWLSGDGNNEGVYVNSSGNVGIGTSSPTNRLHIVGNTYSTTSSTNAALGGVTTSSSVGAIAVGGVATSTSNPLSVGVFGQSDAYAGRGIEGYASGSQSIGVRGYSPWWAGYFNGDVNVTGRLYKSSGSFRIDHPLDPENKYLSHSFVESPDMMNIYNGNVVTNDQGLAAVILPNYFDSLNSEIRYQLTVIGDFAQAIIYEEVYNNQFSIKTDKPNIKVSWMVTGIRQDVYANANRIKVEEMKEEIYQGKYIHPELFGQPRELGIDFDASINSIKFNNATTE